MPQALN